jgi:hypothetical protein
MIYLKPAISTVNLSYIHDFVSRFISLAIIIFLIGITSCSSNYPPVQQPGPPPTARDQPYLGWGGNSSGQIGDGTPIQGHIPS